MLPLSPSSQLQLNPTPQSAKSQRSGADWSHPEIQKEIATLAKTDAWKNYEKGFKEAAKGLNYTNKSTWKRRLEGIVYGIKRLWTRLRSDVMGLIRGIRVNHKHIMNRFMPGIQDWIHKGLKTQNAVEMIKVKGRSIPVHFITFELPKAKSADGVHRIAIFGDPGFNNATLEMNVDGSIALANDKKQALDAVFLTGDSLYSPNEYDKNNARRSSGDTRSFHSNIGAVYQDFIKNRIPVFSPMGNNDNDQGHAAAFANYMSLPRYFKVVAGDCEFFFVDETSMSTLEVSNLDKRFKTTHYTQEAHDLKEAQLHWLDKALSESKQAHPNRKRILVKHFPVVFTNPEVNDKNYYALRRTSFDPFFENHEKYGLTAVLNGHEHLFGAAKIDHIMGADGIPKPLERVISQYTLGSSSHTEPWASHEAYMCDWEKRTWFERNTLRLPQTPGALWSDTGFGMIEVDGSPTEDGKPANVWMNYIKPPAGRGLHYHGSEVNPINPGDEEHPDRFRLIYRSLINHVLGSNQVVPYKQPEPVKSKKH
jgi:hypothetical protein